MTTTTTHAAVTVPLRDYRERLAAAERIVDASLRAKALQRIARDQQATLEALAAAARARAYRSET